MATVVTTCKCKNDFQDQTYGKQQRVFNTTMKKAGDGRIGIRCTACGSEGESARSAIRGSAKQD